MTTPGGLVRGNNSVWVFVAITPVTARNYHYLLAAATSPQVTEADQENIKWLYTSLHFSSGYDLKVGTWL